MTQNALAA